MIDILFGYWLLVIKNCIFKYLRLNYIKKIYIFLAALITSFSINAQIINIPDADFKNALVNTLCVDTDNDGYPDADADTNNDGEISIAEAEAISFLDVSYNNITSLDGIEYFVNISKLIIASNNITIVDISNIINLTELYCGFNQLTTIDISNNINLTRLSCYYNQLTNIDISNNTSLTKLDISHNLLTNLNISNNVNLISLACSYNQLIDLDVSNNNNLLGLGCSFNQLTNLNISNLTNLEGLFCDSNFLTSLDISNSPYLGELSVSYNQLTSLDLSNIQVPMEEFNVSNNQLTSLDLSNIWFPTPLIGISVNNNQLETLIIKNGHIDIDLYDPSFFDFSNNPNLNYICADEFEYGSVETQMQEYGISNYTLNSYCSFVPGGDYYTVEGSVHIDLDNNGCDITDSTTPYFNFTVSNGIQSGNYIANSSGDYSIPVQEGTHTITPTLENPSYFIITPTEITVDFPTDTSPYTQDFCVTTNGTYNDLEITLIPIDAARPGFDANYKVIYKNKGTTTLSGDIDLGFEDDVMDFVTANPANESGLPDLLSWSFTDLIPFESREITFVMNLNAPTDSPPLNDADVLEFIASITSTETDETPEDNTFTLNQTVVNSFDPNDKTCLEGAFVELEDVEKYVHYMIRFENTGTAEAINIVVKDEIDTSKYDLTTLIPLHASHDYFAKIKNNTQVQYVEFIFENINLPFDDANNDGYIAFKIKTLNTLELGDTFENDAEIYFDYNFPILTNNAQTTVGVLSIEEFELANNSVLLYPNPATDMLFLEAKLPIKQINIYDVSGRLIKHIALIGSKNNINISTQELTSGTYFVKIKTEQGETVKKVIKK